VSDVDPFFVGLAADEALMAAAAAFNRPGHEPDFGTLAALGDPTVADGSEATGVSSTASSATAPPASGRRLAAVLRQAVAVRPRLRRLFPGRGPAPDFWDFGPEPRRLLWLPDEQFDELTLRFGAALWGPELAKIVAGPQVRALRRELTPELLEWALGRGRFRLGEGLRAAYRRGPTPVDREGLRKAGLEAVNAAWRPLPPELIGRAGRRFLPATMTKAAAAADADLPRRTFVGLKKILLGEVAPSWRPCFS
jgi:hypothetical protein